ncbi:MAG: hypothetical protein Q8P48_05020 [Deltaproteobacteria bacterium]|nr:hypothetical protein [Deltaproteobacteria bacterium]
MSGMYLAPVIHLFSVMTGKSSRRNPPHRTPEYTPDVIIAIREIGKIFFIS